jgi:AcrR family transcriptional regulator
MTNGRGKNRNSELSSEELKTKVIQIACRHFSMHGFNGVSLKDIAKEAGINASLINYHFKDKAGLFMACTETFARDRMAAIKRILGEPRNRDEVRVRIELFVQEMLASIAADPYSFEIIDREMRAGNPAVIKLFQETSLVAFNSVVGFFKEAQTRGLLREDVDPMLAASLLFSCACDSARKEVIAKRFFNLSFGQPEFRRKFAQTVVGLFMNGVMK